MIPVYCKHKEIDMDRNNKPKPFYAMNFLADLIWHSLTKREIPNYLPLNVTEIEPCPHQEPKTVSILMVEITETGDKITIKVIEHDKKKYLIRVTLENAASKRRFEATFVIDNIDSSSSEKRVHNMVARNFISTMRVHPGNEINRRGLEDIYYRLESLKSLT